MNRRGFLLAGGATAVAWWAPAQQPSDAAAEMISNETQSVIDKSLQMLASTQGGDGSFADSRSGVGNVAITGLAGLALMAGGHQPGRGRFGMAVQKASEYVVRRGNSSGSTPGYLNNADAVTSHSSMYQHGFGALFLSEVYGMMPNPEKQRELRNMLEKSIGMTRNSQNNEGGWRYDPRPVPVADVSVTVAQLMALRAAKNAGVAVPKSVIDKCVLYIKACQLPDGGFCYIKGQQSAGSAFARSAAAIVGLFSAGIYDGKEIEAGLAYMMRYLPGRRAAAFDTRPEHYFYGQYYAALAMWTAGGNYWAEWFPAIREELLTRYRQGNGWTDWHGTAYAAAMACIILQLPNNYLPIMQK
jgi:hypothetical protein